MVYHISDRNTGGPTRHRSVRGRLSRPLIFKILLCDKLRWVSSQQRSRPLISVKLLSENGMLRIHMGKNIVSLF